jgi:hypothetical protein
MDKDDDDDDDKIFASLPGDVRALVKELAQESDKSASRGIGRGWWWKWSGDDFKDETLLDDGGDDFKGERLLRGEEEELDGGDSARRVPVVVPILRAAPLLAPVPGAAPLIVDVLVVHDDDDEVR